MDRRNLLLHQIPLCPTLQPRLFYPLESDMVRDPSTVRADFDAVTALYRGKQLFFYQLGYPSSPVLGSSEEKQVQFIGEVFKAWDAHASQIQMIDFT